MEETQAPSHKVFVYDKIGVFFKHTDYHGFVHPYNYFEWTSYVREAFFRETVAGFRQILDTPIKMMTVKIESSAFHDSYFGDCIEAQLTISRIKKVSFDVIVRFSNKLSRQIVCTTKHTLVFIDSDTQKFADIPDDLKKAVVEHEENEP